MKTCILFESGNRWGGVTFLLSRLAVELSAEMGDDFFVLHDGTQKDEGLIDYLNENNIKQFNYVQEPIEEILKHIYESGYDKIIFHAESWGGLLRVGPFKKKYNIKIIICVNSYMNGFWYRGLVAKYIKFRYGKYVDSWVFFAHGTKNRFCRYADVSDKSWVIPWGIEPVSGINKAKSYVDIYKNEEEPYKDGEKYIFYAANFSKNKSHKELVDLLCPLLKSTCNVKLMFGGDGILMDEVKAYSDSLGLSEKVKFLGWVKRSNFLMHMKNACLSIIISKNETFGYCIIEPLQLGIPVLSYPVGIAPEIVSDFKNGFCVPFNSKERIPALASKIINGEIKLSSSYDDKYSIKSCAESYLKLYKLM